MFTQKDTNRLIFRLTEAIEKSVIAQTVISSPHPTGQYKQSLSDRQEELSNFLLKYLAKIAASSSSQPEIQEQT